jgi:hypothetical protein
VIVGKNCRVLETQYLKESKIVAFRCNGGEGECVIRLDEQNRAAICDKDGLIYPSTEDAAEQF